MWRDGMEVDLEQRRIRRISARRGLGLKFISKDITLSSLLKFLESVLDDKYVLKGGTAISRAGYLSSPRFSEDVDMDCFTGEGLREAGRQLHNMLKGLEGFSVKAPRLQRDCLRCDAYFNNHFGDKDRIRIEASPRKGGVPGEEGAAKTLLQSPFTSGEASLLKTYSKVGLFVRKIHALSGRLDGKDVFDLVGMWSSGVSERVVVKEVDAYAKTIGMTGYTLVSDSLGNLEKIAVDIRNAANSTNHFIPRSERPDWGIVIADLRTLLESLMNQLEKK